MARTTIECATEGCACTYEVHGNNRRDADYRAKKLVERGWTCRDCDNREALAKAEAAGMPKLEGSEKQVAWAATLRNARIAWLDELLQPASEIAALRPNVEQSLGFFNHSIEIARLVQASGQEMVDRAVEALRAEADARFWIDTRHEGPAEVLAGIIGRLTEEDHALSPEGKAEAAAEHEAMNEATLRPANPVSETIAELTYRDGTLSARYEERSDAFNDTVKRIGYRWDAAALAWTRLFNPLMMGTPVDRLAETAHELLAAGCVVALHDAEARAKAVDRSYDPEHRRWVSLITEGPNKGKFRLSWGRDEDFYGVFRGLPGATYRGKMCAVPATSRDEVLDFAEAHGFRLTPGAEAMAAKVLEQRERGIVVEATARPKADAPARCGSRPDRLDVPSDVMLHDDLVDHD